jgi:hypothetical protein
MLVTPYSVAVLSLTIITTLPIFIVHVWVHVVASWFELMILGETTTPVKELVATPSIFQ